MTPQQIDYIRSIPTAKELITTFNELYTQGKVARSTWTDWQKVWSERDKTELQTLASEVFL